MANYVKLKTKWKLTSGSLYKLTNESVTRVVKVKVKGKQGGQSVAFPLLCSWRAMKIEQRKVKHNI